MRLFYIFMVTHLCCMSVLAQVGDATFPVIQINDSTLNRVLTLYTNQTNAKIIGIVVERYDEDYTYTLYNIGIFDSVKKNPTRVFGTWKSKYLLFYFGSETTLSFDDNKSELKLLNFFKKILPDHIGNYKPTTNPDIEVQDYIIFDPIIWKFKVRYNKLLWLRKNLDYQLEKIPYIK